MMNIRHTLDSRVARWTFIHLSLPMLLAAKAPAGLAQATETAARRPEVRPIAIWPSGPLEVVAAFDRPIDAGLAKSYIGRTISYVETRSDGPGQPLRATPPGALRIVGTRLIDGGQTLVMATDPHPRVARYLLPLPAAIGGPALKPLPDATVAYDLTGVEATWNGQDEPPDGPSWSGWWPQLDLEATQRLTRGSRPHEAGFALLSRPGRLTLSSLIRLPVGKLMLRIDASGPIDEALLGDTQAGESPPAAKDDTHHAVLNVESQGEPLFFALTVRTGATKSPFSVKAVCRPEGQKADSPIARDRLIVPWAPLLTEAAITAPVAVPDLSGGDPVRGRTIFSGDQARCAQCHIFRGQGGKVGPDLTEVGQKGRAEIYRSLAVPSAAIEPAYTSYTIATKAGQVFAGVIRAEGPDTIKVTDTNAHDTIIHRDQIQEIRPSATSIMPPGLAAALGEAAVRDLIAFLTSPEPPTPAKTRASP
jgi:putative heme-binding domain-containing protein